MYKTNSQCTEARLVVVFLHCYLYFNISSEIKVKEKLIISLWLNDQKLVIVVEIPNELKSEFLSINWRLSLVNKKNLVIPNYGKFLYSSFYSMFHQRILCDIVPNGCDRLFLPHF